MVVKSSMQVFLSFLHRKIIGRLLLFSTDRSWPRARDHHGGHWGMSESSLRIRDTAADDGLGFHNILWYCQLDSTEELSYYKVS